MSRKRQADTLLTLFPGLSNSVLISSKNWENDKKGKVEANYRLVNMPVTSDLLVDHLNGVARVGLCPISVNGDAVRWCVIDLDVYDYPDYDNDLVPILLSHWPPVLLNWLLPVKTKSGGWHLFFLFEEPVKAKVLREVLIKLAHWLPIPPEKIDRRPDQATLKLEEGDRGSKGTYVNLPLFNSTEEEADQFLSDAMRVVVSEKIFLAAVDEGDFRDAPPCIYPLMFQAEKGSLDGRNFLLYQVGCFYAKKYPTGWEEKLEKFNTAYLRLDQKEVTGVI